MSRLPSLLKSPTVTDLGLCPTEYSTGAWKCPSPFPIRIATVFLFPLATAKSSLPSPLKSPDVIEFGKKFVREFTGGPKVPSPFPTSTEIVLSPEVATARSSFPSPLKSPTIMFHGSVPPAPKSPDSPNPTEALATVISTKTTLDVPPPGLGLNTVTEAVPDAAMSVAVMVAVTWVLETKVVLRGLPFQLTDAPGTNPVPFTVKVNAEPPDVAVTGAAGWLICGTGAFRDTPAFAVLYMAETSDGVSPRL